MLSLWIYKSFNIHIYEMRIVIKSTSAVGLMRKYLAAELYIIYYYYESA